MLATYRKKRDFKVTSEPIGKTRPRGRAQLAYVVQKHAASRLHYDFRLELDGVLKSWAIPKGPSIDPSHKSLAVEVEDHPLEYGDFEGTIPKGQYGGGSVLLWDRGTWEPLDDPHEGLKNGKLHFALHGEKLRGEWTLVRFHGHSDKSHKNWLLIKSRDDFAGKDGQILEERPESVKTKRRIEEINPGDDEQWHSNKTRNGKKHDALSADIRPQLATWAPHPPPGDEWLHEVKLDGYRLIAYIDDGEVRLMTRGNQDWTHRFPRIVKELARLRGHAVLDGEAVVLDEKGRSHFQSLQNSWRAGASADPVMFVFDLLYLNGEDLRDKPLTERKKQLKNLTETLDVPRVKYNDHTRGEGEAVVDAACRMGLEGIVSKLADSKYSGGRTRTWLKSKCGYRQEFIILGYTDPQGSRKEFGSLLLGYYDREKKLVYAGRVGTGFDAALLKEVKKEMTRHARPAPATDEPLPARERREGHWTAPVLVAEIKFAGWTEDNLIRQGAFLGLRQDKKAGDVVREDRSSPELATRRIKQPSTTKAGMVKELTITHPDRVVFPGTKITKTSLAEYYQLVAARMLPHVIDRPLTVVRYPAGIGGQSFIQRHYTESLPPGIEPVAAPKAEGGRSYMMIRDTAGVRALVQINAIEIHAWGCAAGNPERPDRLIFDLDPDPDLPWKIIAKAATELKDILESVHLHPYLKTTGGKGLHIVVPIEPGVDWDHAKAFSKSIAEEMSRRDGKAYTTNIRKAERTGRIFIDYLRNGRTATAVAAYSVRARPGAPVSMPVEWEEIGSLKTAGKFTLENAPRRLKLKDPWADFESKRVDLHRAVGN
ncbi:MAG: DNA ligase D [Tepidisphaeraceae bacterium]|jgi:bifunctional non-homologous end joining protein LigD